MSCDYLHCTSDHEGVEEGMDLLEELAREIVEINTANGWNNIKREAFDNDPDKVLAVIALITSELSEALEAVRKSDKANFDEEWADVLIRLLEFGYGLGVPMLAATRAKMLKNRGRGFRHGGKRV